MGEKAFNSFRECALYKGVYLMETTRFRGADGPHKRPGFASMNQPELHPAVGILAKLVKNFS